MIGGPQSGAPAAPSIAPVFLLADSQLLFWRSGGHLFLERVRGCLTGDSPRAAYIGASNGDVPDYYGIFREAMAGIAITQCQMIRSSFPTEDRRYLEEADVVLLAGGDVEQGWKILEQTRMRQLIERRYEAGAVLIGISAGAVQLGLYGAIALAEAAHRLIDTFKLVPLVVDAHRERDDWDELASIIGMLEGAVSGIGIPSGAGAIYHPDGTLETVRSPATLLSAVGGNIKRTLLLPPETRSAA